MLCIISAWLWTGSSPSDINRFRSDTGKKITKLQNKIKIAMERKKRKERKKEVWNTNFKFVESRAELSTKFDISAESWIEYREF